LDAFARSGMSAMNFSRQHGVHYQTFIAWLRKRRQNPGVAGATGPAFAEILLDGQAPGNSSGVLRIVLPCGAAIELTSYAALPLALELLSNLRSPC
jgi:hypothetical protein